MIATAKLIEKAEKNNNLRKVKEYFETLNLNDFDLGGVEIVEEDFETMAEKLNKNTDVKDVVEEYLYDVRKILDEELEDIEE